MSVELWIILILSVLVVILAVLLIRSRIPRRALENGMALLHEQDFSSRLANTGIVEADNIVAVFNELLAHLKTERLRLREQNHFLDLLIAGSPMGIVIFDYDGRIVSFNRAARDFLQGSPQAGQTLASIATPMALAAAALKHGQSEIVRPGAGAVYRCTAGSFIENGFPRPYLFIEMLTDEIVRAERNAYGKVIRMMSHEVNNTLAGLLPVLELAAAEPDLEDAAVASAARCTALGEFVARLAQVMKIGEPQKAQIRLDEFVLRMEAFLGGLVSAQGASLSIETEALDATVSADPVQLEQVMVNIVKNAAESAGQGGHVTVRADASHIEVIDDGPGISADVADKLFTPFFTSKPGGHGIGLTTAAEILRAHNAAFSLTTVGSLTTFRISFN